MPIIPFGLFFDEKTKAVLHLAYFIEYIFLGVPIRVGLYEASLRFGASTCLTAASTIPNALRHTSVLPQYFFRRRANALEKQQ